MRRTAVSRSSDSQLLTREIAISGSATSCTWVTPGISRRIIWLPRPMITTCPRCATLVMMSLVVASTLRSSTTPEPPSESSW